MFSKVPNIFFLNIMIVWWILATLQLMNSSLTKRFKPTRNKKQVATFWVLIQSSLCLGIFIQPSTSETNASFFSNQKIHNSTQTYGSPSWNLFKIHVLDFLASSINLFLSLILLVLAFFLSWPIWNLESIKNIKLVPTRVKRLLLSIYINK